jgi:hypothetical protein
MRTSTLGRAQGMVAALAGWLLAMPAHAQINQVSATTSAVTSGCLDTDNTGLLIATNAHALASCASASGSALAESTADLPTATAALRLEATNASVSNAAGQTQLVDNFIFQDPTQVLAPNEPLIVGVTFTLDGAVAPGSLTANPGVHPYLAYSLSIIDFYYGADPDALFQANGTILTPTSGAMQFTDTIEVRQPFLNAQLVMNLLGQGLTEGSVDYVASIALDLPAGITWTSTSGVLLTVPEPTPILANAAVLASLALLRVRRSR